MAHDSFFSAIVEWWREMAVYTVGLLECKSFYSLNAQIGGSLELGRGGHERSFYTEDAPSFEHVGSE